MSEAMKRLEALDLYDLLLLLGVLTLGRERSEGDLAEWYDMIMDIIQERIAETPALTDDVKRKIMEAL